MPRAAVPVLVAALGLAGCAAPEPGFFGLAPTSVLVGGEVVDVHVSGRRVIAVRPSRVWPASAELMTRRGIAATETATRCRVAPDSVRAAPNAMTARIDCG